MSTANHKDVIYIDVDDEITAIIEKVRDSQKKIVALVLPKRATVLQSVVNMKLLKRAAEGSKKNLVLITSEQGLLPLAGSVGIHVAKSLNSKPEVPEAPALATATEAVDEADADEPDLDSNRTVGELAGDETIELDDEEEAAAPSDGGKLKKAKNKKFRIPNFNKFRLLLLLGGVAVLLLGAFGYAAVAVLPKALVTIKTDSTAVTGDVVLALKTGRSVKLDIEKSVVPAQIQEVKKTQSQNVPATGEKNKGEKASGNVKLSLKDCSQAQVTIPAGAGVSSAGKTFITQSSATLKSVEIGGECQNSAFPNQSTETVTVEAQTGGSAYNIGPATFTVAGRSNVEGSSSSSMTGGTDDVVKIVTQADIDDAKQKIAEEDGDEVKQELRTALIDKGLYAIDVTLALRETDTKLSAKVNDEADKITVTQTIIYSMLGALQTDLQKVLDKSVEDKIDTKKQSITDYGLDQAEFSLQDVQKDGAAVSLRTTVVAGAELSVDTIKKQVAGKKAGEAQRLIAANPGVTDVQVEYSPFWVSSIPKKIDKITVVIQEPVAEGDDESSSP